MKKLLAVAALSMAAILPAAAEPVFNTVAAVCQAAPNVYAMIGGQRQEVRAIVVSTRTRAAPFVGVRQYAVMPGARAMMRVAGDTTFIVAAPSNVQPQGLVQMAHFETRGNERAVLVGAYGYGYNTGIVADRAVAINFTQASSQAGAPAGTTLYTVSATAPLAAGEYALVVMSGQPQGYAGIPGTFYDFGVD